MYRLGESGLVHWRLLGANNRDLGRGAAAYPGADECRVAITRAVASMSALERVIARKADRWNWRLRERGHDVVVSGRSFENRRTCDEACHRFVAAATASAAPTQVKEWQSPSSTLGRKSRGGPATP
jgi:hypothetical protein